MQQVDAPTEVADEDVPLAPVPEARPLAPPQGRRGGGNVLRRLQGVPGASAVALFLLLLVPCALVVGLRERVAQPIFVFDEFAYADYLHKVHDGDLLVSRGELSGQDAMRELACRGYWPDIWTDDVRPPCGSPRFDPVSFPNGGVNSADAHPPTYFVVTDLGARVVLATNVTDNLIRAGRLFGAAWMAAGLTALWFLARLVGATRGAAAIALALVAGSTALQSQWYYLTPDAPNILVGSLVALAVLRWERNGRGLLAVVGAGALAIAVKSPNVMALGAMALYLIARAFLAWHRRTEVPDDPEGTEADAAWPTRSPRQYALGTAALLGGCAVAGVAWTVVRLAVAMPSTPQEIVQQYTVSSLTVANFAENFARFLQPWDQPPFRTSPMSMLVSYVVVGSLVAVLAVRSRWSPPHTLAGAVGAMTLFGPLLLVAIIFVMSSTYFPIQSRYGTSLLPLQLAVAASVWRGRSAMAALTVVAVAYHAVGVVS